MLCIRKIRHIMVKGRKGADDTDHHRHRMCIATKTLVELYQLLVHHGVVLDGAFKFGLLAGIWQLTVLEQIGDFKKIAVLGELLNRIAAIQQFALVAINERHLGLTTGRR
jgi:uncharacterized membrane protein